MLVAESVAALIWLAGSLEDEVLPDGAEEEVAVDSAEAGVAAESAEGELVTAAFRMGAILWLERLMVASGGVQVLNYRLLL